MSRRLVRHPPEFGERGPDGQRGTAGVPPDRRRPALSPAGRTSSDGHHRRLVPLTGRPRPPGNRTAGHTATGLPLAATRPHGLTFVAVWPRSRPRDSLSRSAIPACPPSTLGPNSRLWAAGIKIACQHLAARNGGWGSPFNRSSAGQRRAGRNRMNRHSGAVASNNVGFLPRVAPLRWRPLTAVILSPSGRSPGHDGFLRERHVADVRFWA